MKEPGRHHNSSTGGRGGGGVRAAGVGGASQALLGQGGGDLVGQRGQLRRVGHVDAAGGRHGAELMGGVFQRDDLGAVVGAGLGRLAEAQFVALNLRVRSQEITLQRPLLGNFIYRNC